MRLSAILLPALTFIVAGFGAGLAARTIVGTVEAQSVEAVQSALSAEDQGWAMVLGDGLQVILEGEAPSEAVRFRAITIAGTQVDASRVIDNMSVTKAEAIAAPDFTVEILRNEAGISLIGLVPESSDRAAIARRIARGAGEAEVTDLLDSADFPAPDGWAPALDYALTALAELDRAKISVTPGRVAIVAMAADPAARRRLETSLARSRPDTVRLALDLTAPRPVIAPFLARFTLDASGARFGACSAGSEEAVDIIAAAAAEAGFEGKLDCPVGLGMPSEDWPEAVARSLAAVARLGGGTVTLTDADIRLVAAEGTDPALFEETVADLERTLPDLFALQSSLPETEEEIAGPAAPPEFTATRSPEGAAQLRGGVSDALMATTTRNYAAARFGATNLTMGTRVREDLPPGWSIRVLAGIEALSRLAHGSVAVTADSIRVDGVSGDPAIRDTITQLLVDRIGPGADFEVTARYDEALDPTVGLPTPEECIDLINAATATQKISFEPGSTDIAGTSRQVVDRIAEILRSCPDLPLEIAGYTDSQGREEMNQQLSQERADAVLAALRSRRVLDDTIESNGYGEADPIADNDTEVGREANRRIEFRLRAVAGEAPADDQDAPSEAPPVDPPVRPELRPEIRPATGGDAGDDGDSGSGDEQGQ